MFLLESRLLFRWIFEGLVQKYRFICFNNGRSNFSKSIQAWTLAYDLDMTLKLSANMYGPRCKGLVVKVLIDRTDNIVSTNIQGQMLRIDDTSSGQYVIFIDRVASDQNDWFFWQPCDNFFKGAPHNFFLQFRPHTTPPPQMINGRSLVA